MRILNVLQAEWKSMTAAQKVKTVLDIVISVGGSIIGGDIARRSAVGRNKAEQVCLYAAGIGLGMAVGEMAQKPVDDLIDGVDKALQQRKQMKQEKEEAANA